MLAKWRMAAIVCLACIVAMPAFTQLSYAAVPKLEQIRVALFLETDTLKMTAPTVTIASPQGITIGNRTPVGVNKWLGGDTLTRIRVGLDRYGVQLLDTTDYAAANVLAGKLDAAGIDAVVWQRSRSGQAAFQVEAGPYPTRELAAAAFDQLTKQPSWSALVKSPALTGPLHWSAGSYPSEAEALSRQAAFSQAGIMADVVYGEDAAGKITYSLWAGSEADIDRLAAVKAQLQQLMPGLQLDPVADGTAYAIRRDDATKGTGGTDRVSSLLIGASNQKLLVSTAAAGAKLTVAEKPQSPGYRGSLELSGYNGKLAVINELPFEQYVGSVVASEMGTGWPLEALKAQAVAARTYALAQGMKYKIANISDSTLDQAYAGKEAADTTQAANLTKGEVLVDKSGLITPIYSANAGGMTADPSEIWGGQAAFAKPVQSPDEGPSKGKPIWRRIALADGTIGFAHSGYLKETGQTNAAGLPIYSVTEDALNVRTMPTTNGTSLTKLSVGTKVVAIGTETESNDFAWYRGPYDAAKLADKLKTAVQLNGPLTRLEVTKRGPSGRVMELQANGQVVKVPYPYAYRSMLGDLLSTKFEIEETGRYTVQGAGGVSRSLPDSSPTLYAVQGAGGAAKAVTAEQVAVMDGSGQVRIVTKEPQFVFRGNGYGHGLGMSQWGARGLAEQGYDYQKILARYYVDVTLTRTE